MEETCGGTASSCAWTGQKYCPKTNNVRIVKRIIFMYITKLSISRAQRLSGLASISRLPSVEDDLSAQVVLLSDVVGAAQFTGANTVTEINPAGVLGDLFRRGDASDEVSVARPIDIDLRWLGPSRPLTALRRRWPAIAGHPRPTPHHGRREPRSVVAPSNRCARGPPQNHWPKPLAKTMATRWPRLLSSWAMQ